MTQDNLIRRLTAGFATLTVAIGFTVSARADVAYSYAQSQVSNLSISLVGNNGTIAPVSPVGTPFLTQTGATLTGFPTAGSPGTFDATQALINAASAENNFSKLASFATSPIAAGTLPTSASSFSHGDVTFTGTPTVANLFGSGVTVNSVAESYLNGTGSLLATATGGWSINAQFTITGATGNTFLNFGYGFANDIYSTTSSGASGASAQSKFNFSYTIKELSPNGTDTGPPILTGNFGTPPNNKDEVVHSGTNLNFASPLALTNGTFTITINGGSQSFDSLASVPEPGPLVLAVVGGGLAGLAGLKRKFGRKDKV